MSPRLLLLLTLYRFPAGSRDRRDAAFVTARVPRHIDRLAHATA